MYGDPSSYLAPQNIHPAVIQKEDVVISVATDASLTHRDPDKDPNFEKFRLGILSPKPKKTHGWSPKADV